MQRRRPRFLAATLVVGLACSLWANCVEAAPVSEGQMACCAAGHHDCGANAKAADCCARAPRTDLQILVGKSPRPEQPTLTIVGAIDIPRVLLPIHRAATSSIELSNAPPGSSPTYLLGSILLISPR